MTDGYQPETALDAPEADAAEQRQELADAEPDPHHEVPFDANEADALEQERVVELDDDDYR